MADYTLMVGAFETPEGADQALPALKQAAKDQGLKVHDAGIVRRTDAGQVQIHDTGDWGFGKGALAGGVVVGAAAIIAGPVGWGLAASGLAGGVIAKVHDANIDDSALRALGAQAKRAASALVIMADPSDEEAIAAVLATVGAVATTAGLDEATASRLAEAAGTAASAQAEPGGTGTEGAGTEAKTPPPPGSAG
jgi:uncharacterized membrane protein